MNNNCMPAEQRDCPHCQTKDSLAYYHEAIGKRFGRKLDLYYCQKCFKMVDWDGICFDKIDGEAYPDRDKK